MTAETYDDRRCHLGEGPLWHPERRQLYWFDILNGLLMTREDGPRTYEIGEMASAAGWVDRDTLLVATETALRRLDLTTGALSHVADLEADDPATRSNDGRADPWGGLWIGTMGKAAEEGAGALYRYRRGELRRLHGGITIANSVAFDPARGRAYFSDTARRTVWRQQVHPETGWPNAEPEVHLDLAGTDRTPDGAVVDAEGNLWIAEWGLSRVTCNAPDGTLLSAHAVPAKHPSCPAFGGPDLTTLYVTTAREGLEGTDGDTPEQGRTYALPNAGRGKPEPKVIP